MAKKIVENQQLMSAAREAINDNFTELYDQVGTGGSSSAGGGIGSAQAIKDVSNFAVDLPDALYVDGSSVGLSIAYLNHMRSDNVVYRVASATSSIYLVFNNDPTGTLVQQSYLDADVWSTDTSIQGYIDAGKAIYIGGSSSSNGSSVSSIPQAL